ncbi:hypothetical protein BH11VER1_BH11VER1_10510 [soil metagenome]
MTKDTDFTPGRSRVFPPPILVPVASLLTLLLFSLALTACGDSAQFNTALEALKEREKRIETQEVSLTKREQELAETTLSLEKQRTEMEVLKNTLNAEFEKLRRQQESLALKLKRGTAPLITSGRAIVIDPATDEVLMEKSADKRLPVASTQKLLTALIIVESGDLDALVHIEAPDCVCPPVRIGLKAGEQYSRRDLLTALMVKSSNDIAQALARDNAGSIEAFAKKMNTRALQLGMKDSRFVNPHGLPADNQYSTASDMAKVARAVDGQPEIRKMICLQTHTFKKSDGSLIPLSNTNRLLKTLPYCDGMKTGYTQLAGYCLISSGEKNGRRRIVVVLNGTDGSIWKDSQALLEWSLKG